MESVTAFLEKRSRLKVNPAKSIVGRPWRRKLPGSSFCPAKGGNMRIRLAPETLRRVKTRLRQLTRKNRSMRMEDRIAEVNRYLRGWLGYFALTEFSSVLEDLDGWVRRRFRACQWKQWKRIRTRHRELLALGLPEWPMRWPVAAKFHGVSQEDP